MRPRLIVRGDGTFEMDGHVEADLQSLCARHFLLWHPSSQAEVMREGEWEVVARFRLKDAAKGKFTEADLDKLLSGEPVD